jgi:MFS family permease
MTDIPHPKAANPAGQGFFPPVRLAVSLVFLVNGLYLGSWTPKVPEIVSRLDLTPGMMGLMVVLFGIGSITIMPISGAMIARHGSTHTLRIAAMLFLPTMLLISVAPDFWTAATACYFFGGFLGALDIAMNANAVEVERDMQRSIMSSCHAFWSMGTLIGAASGGYLIDTIGTLAHAVIVTTVAAGILILAVPRLMPDRVPDPVQPAGRGAKAGLPMSPLPWLLGVICLFSMMPEGSIFDWSALYLNRDLGASLTVASLAGASFSLTMMIMRFAGDLVRDRLGAVPTMRISTILAAIGMAIAGVSSSPIMAIIGFGVCGIGISNMVPIAFSAAGNLPGMAQGVGLSVVSIMGYSGALFAPTLIGFVAEHTGFGPIYASFPVLFLVVLGLSRLVVHADGIKGGAHDRVTS